MDKTLPLSGSAQKEGGGRRSGMEEDARSALDDVLWHCPGGISGIGLINKANGRGLGTVLPDDLDQHLF